MAIEILPPSTPAPCRAAAAAAFASSVQQALNYLKTLPLAVCDDIFIEIARIHSTYCFSEDARELINILNEEFITEENTVISEGRSPPKSKKIDQILRLSVSLHIFNAITIQLLHRTEPCLPGNEIPKSTIKKAISFVTLAES